MSFYKNGRSFTPAKIFFLKEIRNFWLKIRISEGFHKIKKYRVNLGQTVHLSNKLNNFFKNNIF